MSGPTVPVLTLLAKARAWVSHHDFVRAYAVLSVLAGEMPTVEAEEAREAYSKAVAGCRLYGAPEELIDTVWETEAAAWERLVETIQGA